MLEKAEASESSAQCKQLSDEGARLGAKEGNGGVYVEGELALSLDGKPVVGDHQQRTTVTLAFLLPRC